MKSATETTTEQLSALHLLHRAGQCADELFAIHIGDADLTPRQYEVLKAVSQSNDPSQTTLVALTGIDRSTLADIVRRLVERNLLERHRTTRDARKYAVHVTSQGAEVLERASPAVTTTNDKILEALPVDAREAFLESLARIIDVIELRGSQPHRAAHEAVRHHA